MSFGLLVKNDVWDRGLWVYSRAEMLDDSTKKGHFSNSNIRVAYVHQVTCFLQGLLGISVDPA